MYMALILRWWLSQVGNLSRTLLIIFESLQSYDLFLLILLFSECHYYVSHVILFSLRVLGSGGKIYPFCPNLTADHRSPVLSISVWYWPLGDRQPSFFPYPSLVAWGRWEGDHTTMPDLRVINNHQFSPCMLLTSGAHCFSLISVKYSIYTFH